MARPVVLTTIALHPDGAALVGQFAELRVASDTSPDTLRQWAKDVDGIIVRSKLPEDICAHAPRLKALVRHGVGLDFIPVEQATLAGVAVANLPGSNAQAVAEYCFAALLSLRRPVAAIGQSMRAAGWGSARGSADHALELGGSTLGIVGVGTIGKRVARIAAGFGMTVLGASSRPHDIPGVRDVSIDALFAESDAIVLCCALTEATKGLASRERIARMRPGAVLVNVSRGAVVDTPALLDALQSGRIGGAALDVYDVQPLPEASPLWQAPNLLLTPHVAGITATSLRNMSVGAAEEMQRILSGQKPVHLVNPDYLRHSKG
ncbi:MAG: hydroxyacid dehydrogenase [Hyphomicrobiales bacterium]|nr:MAG: hydroxyacid dehydrogenase [Hyphomicrobiales bacterium]